MTPEKFKEAMQKIVNKYNPINETDAIHEEMDELMCKTLEELGFEKGIKIFRETEKWYT